MIKQNATQALRQLLGDRFTTSESDREIHGRSESHFDLMPPAAVAYPTTTDEVQRIVEICSRSDVPMVGWGTGTSLEAQTGADDSSLTIDFSQMKKIRHIDPENMLITVEPGITRKEVNEALRDTGLFFSVDPGANASIGGMAATRASGTTTVRYGTMRDAVKALEVVLADGRIIKTGTYAKKTSAGYDLTALMVGSEGTLGLITELTLKLHPIPEAISAGIVAFESFEGAVQSVIETIQMALPMARMEFVDTATVHAFNAYADRNMPPMPHLLFELHGSEDSVKQDAETFGTICRENGGQDFEWSERTEDRTALWSLRHNGYYAILAARKGARAVVTDICVPISHLADAVEETRADIAASGLMGPILGHVGDGNFHSVLLLDPENKAEHETALALSDRMAQRALAYGGTCTGEHGVGIGKKKFMEAEHGAAWDVMGAIKQALDPRNLMNPGKLVRD